MFSGKPVSPTVKTAFVAGSPALESADCPVGLADRWLVFGICIFLAAIVWLVFGQTVHYAFVNYDDDVYVSDNPVVQKGLTWEGFRWALTYGEVGHWHPLTWLSHMLDCQLFGLNPGDHHLVNVLIHTATVILLFLVLRRMTGFLWRSAFVAAVFAIHPLRVESVAWVAERKDVLSGLFFMLTMGAYVSYVRHSRSMIRYGAVVVFFALGLLSKNMLVTLPFLLLLLDYWPLNRASDFTPKIWRRLVAEKIPLFVLAVASCAATFMVPEKVPVVDRLSFTLRMENAVVSCATYLWQMIHPSGLACFYPNPTALLPAWQVAASLVLLLAVSVAVFAFRQARPYLAVGWLWYVGMMVPVIGIVQIALYARADRYTYLPQIGVYLLLTWAAADLCAGWRHRRVVLGSVSAIIIVALIFLARAQTSYWRNNESLWTHTLACTSDNFLAQNGLGNALLLMGRDGEAMVHLQQALQIRPRYAEAHYNLGNLLHRMGRDDEAMVHFQQALQIRPRYAEAHINLGNALFSMGRLDEAIIHFQQALQINPRSAEVHYNLGSALFLMGRLDEAIIHYQQALQINPRYAEAHFNLGTALFLMGRLDEAIIHLQQALQINPRNAEAHFNLGKALLRLGRDDEAMVHFQQALQLNPRSLKIQNDLAWVLATVSPAALRDGRQAVDLAERANQIAGGEDPIILRTLAAAYAEAGRFDDAVRSAQKARALARAAGQSGLVEQLDGQLKLYAAKLPFHQESKRFED